MHIVNWVHSANEKALGKPGSRAGKMNCERSREMTVATFTPLISVFTKYWDNNHKSTLGVDVDYVVTSPELTEIELNAGRPDVATVARAGTHQVQSTARDTGAWQIGPAGRYVAVTHFRQMGLNGADTISPTRNDPWNRQEYCQVITLYFNREIWAADAPQLLRASMDWLLSHASDDVPPPQQAPRISYHLSGNSIRPAAGIVQLAKSLNAGLKTGIELSQTDGSLSVEELLIGAYEALGASKRTTLTCGGNWSARGNQFDLQIFSPRSGNSHPLHKPFELVEILATKTRIARQISHIKAMHWSDLSPVVQEALNHSPTADQELFQELQSHQYGVSTFLARPDQITNSFLDTLEVILESSFSQPQIQNGLIADCTVFFERLLRMELCMPLTFWQKISELRILPRLIAGHEIHPNQNGQSPLLENMATLAHAARSGAMVRAIFNDLCDCLVCPNAWRETQWRLSATTDYAAARARMPLQNKIYRYGETADLPTFAMQALSSLTKGACNVPAPASRQTQVQVPTQNVYQFEPTIQPESAVPMALRA